MTSALKEKKFLIIDDSPGMRATVRQTLSALGVVYCDMVGSIVDAMTRLKARQYDVIVCDYMLGPGKDGQQFLEDLRHNRSIDLKTIFIMITAERAYEKVISVAELAPDDYLVKPFSAEAIHARLMRAVEKKALMAPIFQATGDGELDKALRLIAALMPTAGKYVIDLIRMKGEILLEKGDTEGAEAIFRSILEMRAIPWAKLGLAKALVKKSPVEAEKLLVETIDAAPMFMAAHDLLSNIHEANGALGKMQDSLKTASDLSPNTLSRQVKLGNAAMANGDMAAARDAFLLVANQKGDSSALSSEVLAKLAIAQGETGDVAAALETVKGIEERFGSSLETELIAAIAEGQIRGRAGDTEGANAAMGCMDALGSLRGGALSEDMTLQMAKAFFENGQDARGNEIMKGLVESNHENELLLQKVKALYKTVGKEGEAEAMIGGAVRDVLKLNNQGVRAAQNGDLVESVRLLVEAAEKLPGNAMVVLNAAQAMLTLIMEKGLDDVLYRKAIEFIDGVKAKQPGYEKLAKVLKLRGNVAKKYGIA